MDERKDERSSLSLSLEERTRKTERRREQDRRRLD
jgi:hypothetical protein